MLWPSMWCWPDGLEAVTWADALHAIDTSEYFHYMLSSKMKPLHEKALIKFSLAEFGGPCMRERSVCKSATTHITGRWPHMLALAPQMLANNTFE